MDEIRSVQSGSKDMPVSTPTVGEASISAEINRQPKTSLLENEMEMDFADATRISQSLENALNANSKEVQFAVTPEEKAGNKINFKVVDRSTGEIVREFPSEEVRNMAEKAFSNIPHGLLIDSSI